MGALVIVESPTKARRIESLLGEGYTVLSSIGHVRDLPTSATQVPKSVTDPEVRRLGVDTENHFKAFYVVTDPAKVRPLKDALKHADELLLATDEDREGEAIAWHLLELLRPTVPVRRMVFHEITEDAIRHALTQTRDIDDNLVNAQEARRILDRLVGFDVTKVLWRVLPGARSAGRVQSVAMRLVVERERERIAFRAATWWGVDAKVRAQADAFDARLVEVDGDQLADGSDFDQTGQVKGAATVRVLDESEATSVVAGLGAAMLRVEAVTSSPRTERPRPPFITSSLQIEGSRKLSWSPDRTMRVAQELYEAGWITYMRTDSTTLSSEAIDASRAAARSLYGVDYVPDQPRRYDKKVRNAQEAHEAIRPSGEAFRPIDEAQRSLSTDGARLYELIWKRTVASQMVDARLLGQQVRLAGVLDAAAGPLAGSPVALRATGQRVVFPGFRRAYVEGSDDPDAELADQERLLPELAEGGEVRVDEATAASHETKPPARYTDATLVRRLEELGIGRPSTYANVVKVIRDRDYVWKKGTALIPSFTAFAVTNLLERYYAELVDYGFTAAMEDDLDSIAAGEKDLDGWLRPFYFGDAAGGTELARLGLRRATGGEIDFDLPSIYTIPIGTDEDGTDVVVRVGRYGATLQRGEERRPVPAETEPDTLTLERALELLAEGTGDREVGVDPESGLMVVARQGRFGPYVQLGAVGAVGAVGEVEGRPKTASLFQTMTPATVTLDEALLVLSLPRVLGHDADGNEVTAQGGRYGPYLKAGTDTRSLPDEPSLFTVTLDEALALFAQPKTRGRRAAAPPLRVVGDDPATGKPIELKQGRFGPYVTDGETNASLRTGDDPATVSLARAAELLQDRRDRGPSTRPARGRGAKKAAKKAPAKKSAAKKTAKKTSAKKATAKQAAAKKAAGAASNAALAATVHPNGASSTDPTA
ncbi:MAG TPA: type I DNA topoisomerase [Acidimicrobiales bacterium]|nr:type I DNA topoisomerase [Acidimicrobiales bacterium]